MTLSPSDLKTSSKAALNLLSRSRSRKLVLYGQPLLGSDMRIAFTLD